MGRHGKPSVVCGMLGRGSVNEAYVARRREEFADVSARQHGAGGFLRPDPPSSSLTTGAGASAAPRVPVLRLAMATSAIPLGGMRRCDGRRRSRDRSATECFFRG